MRLAILLCAVGALPALAESPISAETFDRLTTGRTFYYGLGASPYGAEEYLPDRRVRWSWLDGECQEGRWYAQDGMICFVYEENPEPQCWSFVLEGSGLVARFENDPTQTTLYEMRQSDEPLYCTGPDVGV